jgi:DNA mismatch endonuclease (patch repair protein)
MAFENVSDIVRARMARVRKTETKPETTVRKVAHQMGYRYRKNRPDLPGTPDIVFSARRKIVLVHGCFWHQHGGCKLAKHPRTRPEYWGPKLRRNIERDAQVARALEQAGWQVLVLWECETGSDTELRAKLRLFLGPVRHCTRGEASTSQSFG